MTRASSSSLASNIHAFIQCVKLMVAMLPMVKNQLPVTKFTLSGAILGNHQCYQPAGRAACTLIATHRDDSTERTVSLEQFGFMRCSATTSSVITPLDSDDRDQQGSSSTGLKQRGSGSTALQKKMI